MFTVWKVNLDRSLSNKEHLNDRNEVEDWAASVAGRFATIAIRNDQKEIVRVFTFDGERFDHIASFPSSESIIRQIPWQVSATD